MNDFQVTRAVLKRRIFSFEESLLHIDKSNPRSLVLQARMRILVKSLMSDVIGEDRLWMLNNVNTMLSRHRLLPVDVQVLATVQLSDRTQRCTDSVSPNENIYSEDKLG